MFSRDSRLHASALAHPLRFGAASGAIVAALFAIAGLTSAQDVVRTMVGAAVIATVCAAVFSFATKATP